MTDSDVYSPSVAMTVIYEDRPDLIELETVARSNDWRGRATSYASPDLLRRDAVALTSWARQPRGEFRLESGDNTGIGWALLRFYEIDLAGHIACHVTLASVAGGAQREESISRISFEFKTEFELLARFAKQLEHFADSAQGVAVLEGIV
jgi:hypothetical protein